MELLSLLSRGESYSALMRCRPLIPAELMELLSPDDRLLRRVSLPASSRGESELRREGLKREVEVGGE